MLRNLIFKKFTTLKARWEKNDGALIHHFSGHIQDDRAVVLVEFALTFPIVLAMTLMCIQLCMYWDAVTMANHTAFILARIAKVHHIDERGELWQYAEPNSNGKTKTRNDLKVLGLLNWKTAVTSTYMAPVTHGGFFPSERLTSPILNIPFRNLLPKGFGEIGQRFVIALARARASETVQVKKINLKDYGFANDISLKYPSRQAEIVLAEVKYPMRWNFLPIKPLLSLGSSGGLIKDLVDGAFPEKIFARGRCAMLVEPLKVISKKDFVKNDNLYSNPDLPTGSGEEKHRETRKKKEEKVKKSERFKKLKKKQKELEKKRRALTKAKKRTVDARNSLEKAKKAANEAKEIYLAEKDPFVRDAELRHYKEKQRIEDASRLELKQAVADEKVKSRQFRKLQKEVEKLEKEGRKKEQEAKDIGRKLNKKR